MNTQRWLVMAWAALALLILVSVGLALAAGNNVPETGVRLLTPIPINANALKPTQCANLNLVEIVVWTPGLPPDRDSSLVLGSMGADAIRGGRGGDCILGGGGNDSLDGDQGSDVCIGGPGSDTFKQCETTIQ
jgi:Ca2+-binding RTX toxin-like protein